MTSINLPAPVNLYAMMTLIVTQPPHPLTAVRHLAS